MIWGRALALALTALIAGLAEARSPLRAPDGGALAWPVKRWPLPIARIDASWSRAAATWTSAVDVAFRPLQSTPPLADDGVITMARIESEAEWAALVGDPALVAFTLTTADTRHRLRDADVVINASRFRFETEPRRGAYTSEAIYLHELGHALGLGHSCGGPGAPLCSGLDAGAPEALAVMFPQVPPGAPARPIGTDDRAAIVAYLAVAPMTRRLTFCGAESTAPGEWRACLDSLEPNDFIRIWDAGTVIDADVQPGRGFADVAAIGAGPLDLEAFSAAGQGIFVDQALVSEGPGVEPTPDADASTPVARPSSAGCRTARGDFGLAWYALVVLARFRTRCRRRG